jgi:hypothetical protein
LLLGLLLSLLLGLHLLLEFLHFCSEALYLFTQLTINGLGIRRFCGVGDEAHYLIQPAAEPTVQLEVIRYEIDSGFEIIIGLC